MDIAENAEEGDTTINKADFKIFLEKEADALLSEATMDFSDDRGFIISGMQQTSCCG